MGSKGISGASGEKSTQMAEWLEQIPGRTPEICGRESAILRAAKTLQAPSHLVPDPSLKENFFCILYVAKYYIFSRNPDCVSRTIPNHVVFV